MRIIKLTAENFKRLRAVEIEPNGAVVVVRGRNAQGKSSVLDAIWAALGGKRAVPGKPIREGENHSEITLDLGEYIVTRSFTEKDSYLTVKSREGAKIANPQQLLDSLIGAISFDPLEFARMKATDQAKQLAEITGVNFDGLNSERANLFSIRTETNRRVKHLTGLVDEARKKCNGFDEDLQPVDVGSLMTTYESAQTRHTEHLRALDRLNARTLTLKGKQDERARLLARIAELDEEIMAEQQQIGAAEKALELAGAELPDLTALQKQLQDAAAVNAMAEAVRSFRSLNEQLATESARADELTRDIEAIDRKKAELVAKADLPVNHLSFDENGVYYKDVPFEQCSSSEQLKVSTALAISFNPKLRVIRITDGSLLDEESLGVLESIAESEDFQIWLEKVDDSETGVGILIEDGMIKAAKAEREAVAA